VASVRAPEILAETMIITTCFSDTPMNVPLTVRNKQTITLYYLYMIVVMIEAS
jgi:hypothetical protein